VVEIRAVDAAGVPTGTVLAATTVTGPTGPGDEVTLVAAFAEPAVVATGERYALSLTVGPGQDFALPSRTGNPCEGQAFLDESADGRFEVSPTADHVYTVFVAE
jgi:hypothetical protein